MVVRNLGQLLHDRATAKNVCQLILATSEDLAGFPSIVAECHRNASEWVRIHPSHRIVRGFVVVSDFFFIKHSVVDTGGTLLDITPRPMNESRYMLAFIPYVEVSEAEFASLPHQVMHSDATS